MRPTDDEWFADMVDQMQTKKGLTKEQAEKAATVYRDNYVGQNSHALWCFSISEALKDQN